MRRGSHSRPRISRGLAPFERSLPPLAASAPARSSCPSCEPRWATAPGKPTGNPPHPLPCRRGDSPAHEGRSTHGERHLDRRDEHGPCGRGRVPRLVRHRAPAGAGAGAGLPLVPALHRRRRPQDLGRDLRSRHGRRPAEPGVSRDRRREPVAVVEACHRPGRAPDALRGRSDPARRPAPARRCRRALGERDEHRAGARGRVQRVVRQGAHSGAQRGPGRAVRPPLPGHASGNRKYVALYHLTAPEVQESAAWKEARVSDWTSRLQPHFRDHLRLVCRRYVRGR